MPGCAPNCCARWRDDRHVDVAILARAGEFGDDPDGGSRGRILPDHHGPDAQWQLTLRVGERADQLLALLLARGATGLDQARFAEHHLAEQAVDRDMDVVLDARAARPLSANIRDVPTVPTDVNHALNSGRAKASRMPAAMRAGSGT